jgi:putative ABC transport system permease protein
MSFRERWREWRDARGEDAGAAEEMRFHIEEETARNVRHGMAPEEARRAALRSFGGEDRFREQARDERTGSAVADLWTDVRYAGRSLRSSPGFTLVAVLTLALGIGANSGIFSVVNGVVLRPLPYAEPDALVRVATRFPTLGLDRFWLSLPEFVELRERVQSFSAVGGYRTWQVSIGAEEAPLRVPVGQVTHGFFDALGVAPLLGRAFTEEETLPDAEPVVMLSHGLWQRAFGGDPAIIGRMVLRNGVEARVTGVMPPGFDIADAGVDAWMPWPLDPANPGARASHVLDVVARLRPGTSFEQAQAELAMVVANWAEANPDEHAPGPDGHPVYIVPLQEDVIGDIRPALLLLLGAVGFVLLIACANVANLLLARSEARQREIAVRSALGAGTGRLLRQFLTEGLVLAVLGGVLGVFVGWAGVRLLIAANPESIPRAAEIGLDGWVLLFTTGIAVLTGVIFGLAPALHLSRGSTTGALREGGLRTTTNAARQRLRRLLVVSELALAVILIVGSALMLRSFAELQRVDPGFDPEGLLTFQVFLPSATYPGAPPQTAFHDRLLERLEGLPGVRAVTAMSGLPPVRDVTANSMVLEGIEPTEDGPGHLMDYVQSVQRDYFSTMRIPLRAGRVFEPQDAAAGGALAVVNERVVRTFYEGLDPVGRRFSFAGPDGPWYTIIGVVGDVKQGGLEAPAGTEAYLYVPQVAVLNEFAPRTMNYVLRTTGDPAGHAASVRRAVRELDESLPVANLATMGEVLSGSLARPRFLTLLLGIFAGVALALAAIGTYGVMAYSVVQRRQELGIRMALGARPDSVLGLVLAQGLTVAAVGLVIGSLGALALTRTLSGLLYNVSANDPVAFAAAPILLGLVALLACYIPARRATRVDPVTVLKAG